MSNDFDFMADFDSAVNTQVNQISNAGGNQQREAPVGSIQAPALVYKDGNGVAHQINRTATKLYASNDSHRPLLDMCKGRIQAGDVTTDDRNNWVITLATGDVVRVYNHAKAEVDASLAVELF